MRCPNCGTELSPGTPMCPYCGADPRMRPPGRNITPYPFLDGLLGFLAVIALTFTGFGIVVAVILAFVLKDSHPAFATGIRVCLILMAVLLLGAIVVCFMALSGTFRP